MIGLWGGVILAPKNGAGIGEGMTTHEGGCITLPNVVRMLDKYSTVYYTLKRSHMQQERILIRIFKSKGFSKFAKKEKINNKTLIQAVRDAEAGLINADYGGGVVKQRISRPNEGKSGGYRSIILYRKGDRAFFVYGFAKNERDNIDKVEERDFKDMAKTFFSMPDEQLELLLKQGKIKEVMP